jgi:putative transposase
MAKASEVCRALNLSPSSYYATSKRNHQSLELEQEAVDLSRKNPRYGYRRVTALMRRAGHVVNEKRVQALRRRHGLQVRKKQRRMKRVHANEALRLTASEANEVWSWDFVFDQTEWGSSYRILSVIDEYTRQCKSLQPRRSYRARNVIEVLDELIEEHGAPKYIRSDNGPEFIAYEIQDWLKKRGIKTHYIKPGSPWEQCYIESFHDKLRDEFLNREIFYSLAEAEIRLEDWRGEYNADRIHSSLDYRTPDEFAACCKPPLRATPSTPTCSREETPLNQNHRPNLIESTV